jgi:thiamine kinase-like enzyme
MNKIIKYCEETELITELENNIVDSLCNLNIKKIHKNDNMIKGGFISNVFEITIETETEVLNCIAKIENDTDNLLTQMSNNLDLYNKYIHAKSIFKKLDNLLFYYNGAIFSVIHGDPVFTNVLQTEQGLKFIDMKGKIDNELTIIGDTYYDLAKVYQSILGYDFILNDIELDNIYIDEFKKTFEGLFKPEGLRIIKIITASLFFTLMPLHTEDQDKFAKYFKIINTLLDECRDN